jgi:hypothetical protein
MGDEGTRLGVAKRIAKFLSDCDERVAIRLLSAAAKSSRSFR